MAFSSLPCPLASDNVHPIRMPTGHQRQEGKRMQVLLYLHPLVWVQLGNVCFTPGYACEAPWVQPSASRVQVNSSLILPLKAYCWYWCPLIVSASPSFLVSMLNVPPVSWCDPDWWIWNLSKISSKTIGYLMGYDWNCGLRETKQFAFCILLHQASSMKKTLYVYTYNFTKIHIYDVLK